MPRAVLVRCFTISVLIFFIKLIQMTKFERGQRVKIIEGFYTGEIVKVIEVHAYVLHRMYRVDNKFKLLYYEHELEVAEKPEADE